MNTFFIPLLSQIGWGWVWILLAVLLLFGGKKIPELMKGTGKGIREFKKGLKGDDEDDSKEES